MQEATIYRSSRGDADSAPRLIADWDNIDAPHAAANEPRKDRREKSDMESLGVESGEQRR